MIKSMTGYGRAESASESFNISAEIKSVNHRYFEFNCRMPRSYIFLEDKIRSHLSGLIARGKVDVFISIEATGEAGAAVEVNHQLAQGYIDAINEISDKYNLNGELTALSVSRLPDVVSVSMPPVDEETLWEELKSVLTGAAASLAEMRAAEGEKMYRDIKSRLEFIGRCVDTIDGLYPETVRQYRERIEERIKELLGDVKADEQRLITETAIMADRMAIDEETVRLRSHIAQMESMLLLDEPSGRKMDFLVQEMNREINTIGSKSQNIEIAKCVVDVKAEIEKIREQVQNIQ